MTYVCFFERYKFTPLSGSRISQSTVHDAKKDLLADILVIAFVTLKSPQGTVIFFGCF